MSEGINILETKVFVKSLERTENQPKGWFSVVPGSLLSQLACRPKLEERRVVDLIGFEPTISGVNSAEVTITSTGP